jgi:DNA-binding response OmpR family regulator
MARILVIEDQEMLRATIRMVLEGAGHQIDVAVDGADGLRQARRSHFALVLCDVFMPNKDGIATLTELRRTDASVPVIMMSGGSPRRLRAGDPDDMDYLQLAEQLGATRTVAKPFNARELRTLVDEVLAEPRPPSVH